MNLKVILFHYIFLLLFRHLQCVKTDEQSESNFTVVKNWPFYSDFGQISGVGIDSYDNIYVFHRASRQWDSNTFSVNNTFLGQGPITKETIVVLEPKSGSLLGKTGKNRYVLSIRYFSNKNTKKMHNIVFNILVFSYPMV